MNKKMFNTLVFIGANLLVLGVVAGMILYTLMYTAIPVSAQHLWYATTLQNYLFWDHLITTIFGATILAGVNTFLILDLRKQKAIDELKKED